ncbi:hypothetical protein [Flavihumibacter petaseus]|uniref:Uncharacterized protein n=1 Tax=Flavihumibacter petaseus NBRC 106054 TaxID=1220578 RepID=A0A0E9N5D7_9BACT|nr:hypothetical protein [Flavihumibacter petaseus]GAO45018.1 hypothetical protein FPE01S_04_02610 [Flavihumibacter petaseus NBRC 106054]
MVPNEKSDNQSGWRDKLSGWDGRLPEEGGRLQVPFDKEAAWEKIRARQENPAPAGFSWKKTAAIAAMITALFFVWQQFRQKTDIPVQSPVSKESLVKSPAITEVPPPPVSAASTAAAGREIPKTITAEKSKVSPGRPTKRIELLSAAPAHVPAPTDSASQRIQVPANELIAGMSVTPVTPKKIRVVHINDIRTPQELLSIQPVKEQKQFTRALQRQSPDPGPPSQQPGGWVIQLNN